MNKRRHKNENFTVEYDLIVTKCPCGSNKSPKKCCGLVKPRTYSAEMDPINFYESDGIAIGVNYQLKRIVNNKLEPLIGDVQFSQKYKRIKGDKIIIKGLTDNEYVMSPESILINSDAIYFVDTNTKIKGEHEISITGVLHAYIDHIKSDVFSLNWLPLTLLEFWDSDINPEVIGWYAVICAILEVPENKNKKILLIVDSKLDELESLNRREIPLCGDFYIPKNIRLEYASADIASNIANKLIKKCDKFASNKLNKVLNNTREDSLKETDYPCRWFRQWTH